MSTQYSVEIIYSAEYYPEIDEKLNEIFGRYSDGSGMGFDERDVSWCFKTRRIAQRYFDKCLRVRKLSQISLRVEKE